MSINPSLKYYSLETMNRQSPLKLVILFVGVPGGCEVSTLLGGEWNRLRERSLLLLLCNHLLWAHQVLKHVAVQTPPGGAELPAT